MTTKRRFLPRDVSAVFAVVGVFPSARLSRWCIVSRRLKISSSFFLGPVAPSFCSFFLTPAPIPNSKGNPFSGDAKYTGGKICDFQLKSPLILETVRDIPMVAMDVNRKS